jgi:uncharacterized membrane protein (UPF0127 family)
VSSISIGVRRACGFFGRFRGLIGRPSPAPGEALLLEPCRQVHTLFMSYPIDVVHLDAAGAVLAVQTLSPWRLGRWLLHSSRVLELRAGEAARLGLEVGVRPSLIEVDARVTTGNG